MYPFTVWKLKDFSATLVFCMKSETEKFFNFLTELFSVYLFIHSLKRKWCYPHRNKFVLWNSFSLFSIKVMSYYIILAGSEVL